MQKEKRNLTLKDSAVLFVLCFLMSQIGAFLGSVIISGILKGFGHTKEYIEAFSSTPFGYLISYIFYVLPTVLVIIFYLKHTTLYKNSVNKKMKFLPTFLFCVFGIASLYLLSYIVNLFELVNIHFGKTPATLPYQVNNIKSYFISIITFCIIPAFCEEFLFRGIIFNGLKEKGTYFAIFVSSIMFAIFHFSTSQLIYPLLFGILLSFIVYSTGNIFCSIIVHFINNFFTITIQYISNSQATFSANAKNIILAIVGLIIWCSIMTYLILRRYKQDKKEKISTEIEAQPKTQTNNKNLLEGKIYLAVSFLIMVSLYIALI